MSIVFEKLYKFDIDCDRLYNEWNNVLISEQQRSLPYLRIAINRSNLNLDSTDNIVGVGFDYDLNTFSANNISKEFQSSYTKEVVKLVEGWLNNRNLRSTRIKYAALKGNSKIPLHTDTGLEYRYHLTIKTNSDNWMTINEQNYPINETATLYRMLSNIPHSVTNAGTDLRLLLTFDVVKFNLEKDII